MADRRVITMEITRNGRLKRRMEIGKNRETKEGGRVVKDEVQVMSD